MVADRVPCVSWGPQDRSFGASRALSSSRFAWKEYRGELATAIVEFWEQEMAVPGESVMFVAESWVTATRYWVAKLESLWLCGSCFTVWRVFQYSWNALKGHGRATVMSALPKYYPLHQP